MELINLSTIIGDSCVNSFVLAFQSMPYSGLLVGDEDISELISTYLFEYKDYIIPYLQNSLHKKCFVTSALLEKQQAIEDKILAIDKNNLDIKDEEQVETFFELKRAEQELEWSQLFNDGIYNLVVLLAFIDKSMELDMKILQKNFLGEYFEGDNLLQKKMDLLTTIHLGVSSFVITSNQKKKEFEWNKHYDVGPDMQYIIRNQRKYQNCKGLVCEAHPEIEKKGEMFLSDILLIIDLYRVKHQCIVEKFMIALLFIQMSPEYENWMQEYAYTLINILNEVMFCGEIHSIYLQEGYYNTRSDEIRTSNDAVTRISIIFSADNDDFFVLRIDMPHKGENTFHINMEEVVEGKIYPTGYPMSFDEFYTKTKHKYNDDVFDSLFFEINGQIWFRSMFEKKLKNIADITDEMRDELYVLFHCQGHIKISTEYQSITSGMQLAFIEELKKYLKRMAIPDSFYISFGKDDIGYAEKIKNIRGVFNVEWYIIKEIKEKLDCRTCAENVMDLFESYMGISKCQRNGFNVTSIIEVWELLENYLCK